MECKVFQVLTNLHKQKYETLTNFYRVKQTQNKVISKSTKWQKKMENFRKVLPSYTNINNKVFTKLPSYKNKNGWEWLIFFFFVTCIGCRWLIFSSLLFSRFADPHDIFPLSLLPCLSPTRLYTLYFHLSTT